MPRCIWQALILGNKIYLTLQDIIGPSKTAAIKGRTIIEYLQLNQDVMSYANANKIQVAMVKPYSVSDMNPK